MPCCPTTTVVPATVGYATREVREFPATKRVTLPLPEPEELPETVIQVGRSETVQTHEELVWMLTV